MSRRTSRRKLSQPTSSQVETRNVSSLDPIMGPTPSSLDPSDREGGFDPAVSGERLRRLALGSTAALLAARPFWPSEPDLLHEADSSLYWVFSLMIVVGVALASALIGGRLRVRLSWADAAVVSLVALVSLSARHAMDHRPAINLAWDWVGLGIAYLLIRCLPRTQGESKALAGILVATAVAVSTYGLYQAKIEIPLLQKEFLRNPTRMLEAEGIAPGTAGEAMFRDRLLGSDEVFSTFGLANSLAGYLTGPIMLAMAIGLASILPRDRKKSAIPSILLASLPFLAMLICLILTKSRKPGSAAEWERSGSPGHFDDRCLAYTSPSGSWAGVRS